MNRRQFLRLTGGVAIVGATGALAVAPGARSSTGADLRSALPLPRPFQVPLPIPAEAGKVNESYRLVQRANDIEILPGTRTRIHGYDGTFPGPTLTGRRGEAMDVHVSNELDVGTVVHLHGGHTPPEHDGYPTDLILPRSGRVAGHAMPGDSTVGERTYRYPLDQRAALLWYHDHAMDYTGPNVYAGLAGLCRITDADESALPLPDGDRELPLLICDRAFDGDAQFRYPALAPDQSMPGVEDRYMGGVLGDVILVNGAPWPIHDVSGVRYRLRVLNASNARRYRLTLDPPPPEGKSFTRIGSDGGLLQSPIETDAITLASAERADLIVDFGRYPVGTEVTMRNEFGSGSTAVVMRFVVARRGSDDSSVPGRLSEIEPLQRSAATAVRHFHFGLQRADAERLAMAHDMPGHTMPDHRWTVNATPFDPDVSLADPQLGATEIWRFTTNVHHPVHLHLVQMQVLARNSGSIRDGDEGWKDTIDLLPGESCEVITRFDGYRGRYVFHCHNLEHEDMAMMANFTVT